MKVCQVHYFNGFTKNCLKAALVITMVLGVAGWRALAAADEPTHILCVNHK